MGVAFKKFSLGKLWAAPVAGQIQPQAIRLPAAKALAR